MVLSPRQGTATVCSGHHAIHTSVLCGTHSPHPFHDSASMLTWRSRQRRLCEALGLSLPCSRAAHGAGGCSHALSSKGGNGRGHRRALHTRIGLVSLHGRQRTHIRVEPSGSSIRALSMRV